MDSNNQPVSLKTWKKLTGKSREVYKHYLHLLRRQAYSIKNNKPMDEDEIYSLKQYEKLLS